MHFYEQILTKILQYSSHADLLHFRRVCKTWHGLVTSHLLRKDPIHRVVTHESDLSKLLIVTKKATLFPIQSFYYKIPGLTYPSIHVLHKTLSLKCMVSLKIVIDSKHFPETVKTIRLHMKSLKHLAICRIPEFNFEAIGPCPAPGKPSSPTGKLPNLKSLILRNAKPSKNFMATYDGAVLDLIKAAHGSLERIEFWHWGFLTKILRESNFSNVKTLKVIGGKLSELDLMILIGKSGMMLDSFTARVDKSTGKQLVNEFLEKRVVGSRI